MSTERRLRRRWWKGWACGAAVLLLAGCLVPKEHRYEEIRKEFGDVVCRLDPAGSEKGELKVCDPSRPISLEEAIGVARANNPDNRMAAMRIRRAEALLAKSEAAFYPGVGFYTEYLQGDAPSAYLFKAIDQRKLPPNVDFNDPGWFENYETGVRARLNLYNGGRDILQRRMAESGLTVSRLDRAGIENELVSTVIRSYYGVLASGEFLEIARESRKTVASQLKVMQVQYEGGSLLKSDILSLRVRLAQAEEEIIRRENQLQLATTALADVMGVEAGSVRIDPIRTPVAAALPEDWAEGLAYAMDHRAEIRKAREEVVRARTAMDVARAGYFPRVDLDARSYVDDPNAAYNSERENWTAAVMFQWDLFSGFSTRAEVDRSEAALAEALAADRKVSLAVRTDVRTAYLNLQETRARQRVAEASVASAEESLNLVQVQYQGGSATVTRYLEVELARNRSRTRAAAAYYDQQKALSEVGRAVGFWAGTETDNAGEPSP
ncbi:MAG: TolC family protein [Desulfobacteraceae bacterium]|jgi:outer membrane protein|nr:TolC family protein [Desulfobacteraceae bacterium]